MKFAAPALTAALLLTACADDATSTGSASTATPITTTGASSDADVTRHTFVTANGTSIDSYSWCHRGVPSVCRAR